MRPPLRLGTRIPGASSRHARDFIFVFSGHIEHRTTEAGDAPLVLPHCADFTQRAYRYPLNPVFGIDEVNFKIDLQSGLGCIMPSCISKKVWRAVPALRRTSVARHLGWKFLDRTHARAAISKVRRLQVA